MQCKDIEDSEFLGIVEQKRGPNNDWVFVTEVADGLPQLSSLPLEERHRLVRAKARGLIKRGLLDGCACGCRGDFELTDKGEQLLKVAG